MEHNDETVVTEEMAPGKPPAVHKSASSALEPAVVSAAS